MYSYILIVKVLFLSGIVTKAKGSSYLEKNGAKLICAVYGPREAQRKTEFSTQGRLVCEAMFAPFSHTEKQRNEEERKNLSSLLETALTCAVSLDSFPKSQIEIYLNVLQDSGDVLAPAIICASLALLDAGIEMYDVVSACSVVFDDDNIAMDPIIDEVSNYSQRGSMTVGYLPSLNRVSCLVQDGTASSERSMTCIRKCIEGCIRTHSVMKDCILNGARRKEEQMKQYSS